MSGYLEADRTGKVRFYQKFGFIVLEQSEVLGVWLLAAHGGWAKIRTAHRFNVHGCCEQALARFQNADGLETRVGDLQLIE